MSTNAARRITAEPIRHLEATIVRHPAVGHGVSMAANTVPRPGRPAEDAAKRPRGDIVVPVLLAVLLVLACLAWEALSRAS